VETGKYTLHRRAKIALHQLPEDEQNLVLERVAALADIPFSDWPVAVARKLPGEPSLFLVSIDESLRLLVRVAEGQQPEVQDIVRRETLETFARIRG
jgi:hypothetical protein